jgi:anti-sigma factor RsiW
LNCKSLIRELSNYIDGELDSAVKPELERHLAHCGDCAMIFDQTRRSIEILCDSQPVSLPADIRERLQEALRAKLAKKTS